MTAREGDDDEEDSNYFSSEVTVGYGNTTDNNTDNNVLYANNTAGTTTTSAAGSRLPQQALVRGGRGRGGQEGFLPSSPSGGRSEAYAAKTIKNNTNRADEASGSSRSSSGSSSSSGFDQKGSEYRARRRDKLLRSVGEVPSPPSILSPQKDKEAGGLPTTKRRNETTATTTTTGDGKTSTSSPQPNTKAQRVGTEDNKRANKNTASERSCSSSRSSLSSFDSQDGEPLINTPSRGSDSSPAQIGGNGHHHRHRRSKANSSNNNINAESMPTTGGAEAYHNNTENPLTSPGPHQRGGGDSLPEAEQRPFAESPDTANDSRPIAMPQNLRSPNTNTNATTAGRGLGISEANLSATSVDYHRLPPHSHGGDFEVLVDDDDQNNNGGGGAQSPPSGGPPQVAMRGLSVPIFALVSSAATNNNNGNNNPSSQEGGANTPSSSTNNASNALAQAQEERRRVAAAAAQNALANGATNAEAIAAGVAAAAALGAAAGGGPLTSPTSSAAPPNQQQQQNSANLNQNNNTNQAVNGSQQGGDSGLSVTSPPPNAPASPTVAGDRAPNAEVGTALTAAGAATPATYVDRNGRQRVPNTAIVTRPRVQYVHPLKTRQAILLDSQWMLSHPHCAFGECCLTPANLLYNRCLIIESCSRYYDADEDCCRPLVVDNPRLFAAMLCFADILTIGCPAGCFYHGMGTAVAGCWTRWMVRRRYRIEGFGWQDMFMSTCCVSCTAAQIRFEQEHNMIFNLAGGRGLHGPSSADVEMH